MRLFLGSGTVLGGLLRGAIAVASLPASASTSTATLTSIGVPRRSTAPAVVGLLSSVTFLCPVASVVAALSVTALAERCTVDLLRKTVASFDFVLSVLPVCLCPLPLPLPPAVPPPLLLLLELPVAACNRLWSFRFVAYIVTCIGNGVVRDPGNEQRSVGSDLSTLRASLRAKEQEKGKKERVKE